jgi:hypothetical protein
MPQRRDYRVPPRAARWSRLRFFILIGVMLAAALALALCSAGRVRAHGEAAWIGDRQIKNWIGELCCGERDCARLADDDVITTARGYFIRSTGETVPYGEALPTPSEIGGFWRCYWGGVRKCFFAPPQGS